jgi:hypothetical protein
MDLEQTLRHNLLTLAFAYRRATGLKLSTISSYMAGDSRFFVSLASRKPNGFTVAVYQRAVERFKAKWPADVPIPEICEPATFLGPYWRPKP